MYNWLSSIPRTGSKAAADNFNQALESLYKAQDRVIQTYGSQQSGSVPKTETESDKKEREDLLEQGSSALSKGFEHACTLYEILEKASEVDTEVNLANYSSERNGFRWIDELFSKLAEPKISGETTLVTIKKLREELEKGCTETVSRVENMMCEIERVKTALSFKHRVD